MDFNLLINQFLGSDTTESSNTKKDNNSKSSGFDLGSLAAGTALGGAAGFLANSATGKQFGRRAMRAGRTAAGIGGLALVGGLAYKAFNHYKNNQGKSIEPSPITTAPVESSFNFNNESVDESKLGLIVLRSMIAAANADGKIDADEQNTIFGQMNHLNITDEEKNWLFSEMKAPLNALQISQLCVSEEEALQAYSAALMAIEVDTTEEQKFMFDLRDALKIDAELASNVEIQILNLSKT